VTESRHCSGLRLLAAGALVGGLVVSGCLGQDFLAAPLELTHFDHGWRVNVEPAEEFAVDLVANPLYPDVPWRLVDFDPAVVAHRRTNHITSQCRPTEENPCPVSSETEPFLPHTRFDFVGVAEGESPLHFALEVDGRPADVTEYSIAVVADACTEDVGISANRCGWDDRSPNLEIATFEDGMTMPVELGETFTVTLAANAQYPEAPWQIVEIDPTVLALRATEQDPVRALGDWDTSDDTKPWHFLAIWRTTFEAIGYGTSPLILEVVSGGEQIDVFEIAVTVGDSNEEATGEISFVDSSAGHRHHGVLRATLSTTVMTDFPRECPSPRYAIASGTSARV